MAATYTARRRLKLIAPTLLLLVLGVGGKAATAPDSASTPILVELFTSEGCSSCPPVDNWVAQLDAAQPVAGAQLIVLSEHVDYWDHDGWKDPFSSAAFTDRQTSYVHELRLSDVYTPQVVMDGAEELKPADGEKVSASLQKAAAAPMVAVKIDSTAVASGEVSGKVEADGSALTHGGDVFVAIAIDKTQTDILAGENNGKKLTNIAVVRQLVKIGKLDKGKTFDQPFRIKLWPGADPANLRVIAFVQESGPGKVLGAGMTKDIQRAAE
jgi:hypothetical protein